jgi:hypothetical protein
MRRVVSHILAVAFESAMTFRGLGLRVGLRVGLRA